MARAEEVLTKRPGQIKDLKVTDFLRMGSTSVVTGKIEMSESYDDAGSFQPIAADLELGADAGTDEVGDSDYLAPIMGNVMGADLTKPHNIIGGVIGKMSVTGTNASDYPIAGVVGEIGDGVTAADGAFVAVLGGDSEQTNARAAFTVDNQNSTPGSGFDFGMDLQGVDHDSFGAVAYVKCVARYTNNVCKLIGAGAPTSGASGTGDNFAGPGSEYTDITNGNLYIQIAVITAPDWKLVTRAA